MKVSKEMDWRDFTFWSGAAQTFDILTEIQLSLVWRCLEELYPEGLTETEINDFFWFDVETIAEWLGFEDFEELYQHNKEN